jgi:hypothetical protein
VRFRLLSPRRGARSARTSRRRRAATMTVLIAMFLLGLFIALFTWRVSWSTT